MSKIRNLTSITGANVATDDIVHIVDVSQATGDRKITIDELKIALGLNTLEKKFLEYYNSSLQTNSTTTFTDITMSNDLSSTPGSLLTKASASQFRSNFTGFIKIGFKVHGYTDTNDRSVAVRIAKNGAGQDYTKVFLYGKNVLERSSSGTGSYIFPVVANDYFTLQFASAESGITSTIPASSAVMFVESFIVTSIP